MNKGSLAKVIAIVIAALGIILGIVMVVRGSDNIVPAAPYAQPPQIPFDNYIAGSGIVETSSEELAIATPISGVVEQVYVSTGDTVKKGQPLFRLDEREEQAKLALQKAELEVAQKKILEANSTLENKLNLLNLVNQVSDKRAVSREEIDNRRHAVRLAQAELQTAKAMVERHEKEIAVIETDLERMTVRAPIDGEVLQVNIHVGEYAAAEETTTPLMLLGSVDPLHLKVDIDEHDAWRFDPNGQAVAVPRGNPSMQIPLELVYVKPFIVPKKSLTGESNERIDTRVLQVVYKFNRNNRPIYVGQQMDAWIETPDKER